MIGIMDQDTEIDEDDLVAGHPGEGVGIETAIPVIARPTTGGGVHIEVERGVTHLTGTGATHLISVLEGETGVIHLIDTKEEEIEATHPISTEEGEIGVIRPIGTLVVKEGERRVTHLRGAVPITKREEGIHLRRKKKQTDIGSTRNTTSAVTISIVTRSENPRMSPRKRVIQVKRKVTKMTRGVGDNALIVIISLTNSFSQQYLPRDTL